MFSKVILFGNLGRDPELRYTQGENTQPITNVSVAVHKPQRNPDGSWGKETIWWDVSFKGRKAETICQYLHKGSKVFIEGKHPNYQTWQKQDNTTGVKNSCIGVECVFADSLEDRQQYQPRPSQTQAPVQQPLNQSGAVQQAYMEEDDIPF